MPTIRAIFPTAAPVASIALVGLTDASTGSPVPLPATVAFTGPVALTGGKEWSLSFVGTAPTYMWSAAVTNTDGSISPLGPSLIKGDFVLPAASNGNLITPDRAAQNATLRTLAQANPAALASMISSASDVIQRICLRRFGPASYTEYYSGLGYPNQLLPLNQFPVASISRVATRPVPAVFIGNSVAQRATVATTATDLVLMSVTAGAVQTLKINFGDQVTLGGLAAAVTAIGGGWSARVDATYSLWPSIDLSQLQGAMSCVGPGGAPLELYTEDLNISCHDDGYANLPHGGGWRLDAEAGQLWGYFPEGKRNIRVDYTVTDAVPQDVQQACVRLCALMVEDDQRNSAIEMSQLGPYEVRYTKKAESLVKNPAVWDFIGHHRDQSKLLVVD